MHEVIAVGLAAGLPHDRVLDLGPFHPSGQGAWQLAVETDGERILAAEPRIGLVHRSDEKLFASRDYRQLLAMAGRHAWFTSFHGELVVALAVEEAMGIAVSPLVTWSRTLLAELDRIQASLLLLDSDDAREHREHALALVEAATGNRVHPMALRIGGLGSPLQDAWLDELLAFATGLPVDALGAEAIDRASAHAGAGTLTHDDARALGASGPVGRASGIALDVRAQSPYLAYGELSIGVPVRADGDVPARVAMLASALAQSASHLPAITAQVRAHAGEPTSTTLPKTVKVPVGTTIATVESPLGLLAAVLVSEGDRVPARVKLRTPSFAHLQALAVACAGLPLDELDAVVRSFCIAIGEADR